MELLKTKVRLHDGFTPKEAMMIYKCLRVISAALPTQEYKTRFLSRDIKHDQGLSNDKLFHRLVTGWDRFSREARS